jgi:hypothetical protein
MNILANNGTSYCFNHATIKWMEGKPDKPGWYPASEYRDPRCLRFFDGANWSMSLTPAHSQHAAGIVGVHTSPKYKNVLWAKPWWLKNV